MTAIFKNDINKEIHKRLEKFIEFKYEEYVLSAKNSGFVKDYQNEVHKLAEHYRSYCKDDIDDLCLGVIILEIAHLSSFESRAENINNKIKPLLNPGSNELLEAIKAFEQNSLNIEEIIIKTKQPKDYITDPNYNPKDYKKGSYLKHLNISGRIAINRLMNGVKDNTSKNQLSSIVTQKKLGKTKNTNFYTKAAKLIHPFLEKNFDHLSSNNERYFLGADLLKAIELEPKYRNVENDSSFKRTMMNNFKKALNS